MTATPKELLEAATNTTQGRVSVRCAELCALYIRSTVRADDDEAITLEWIQQLGFERTVVTSRYEKLIKTGWWLTWDTDGDCCLSTHCSVPLPNNPKTRGQFRSLCRALGITLPEVQE